MAADAAGVIRATLNGADGLVVRLTSHAAQLASAAAESRLRAGRADPLRWRMAGLLWPLFTKD